MIINKQNYLEVKQSSFLAVCSFRKNDMTTSNNLKSCETEGCLLKFCSRSDCYHFLKNKYYCNNYFTVNKSIRNDNSERIFRGSNNDDCVTVFGKYEGDEDIQSVEQTLNSMSDITLFDRLPDWVVPEPEHLDSVMRPAEHLDSVTRPVECLILPTHSDNTNDNNESGTSNISDDGSDIIPVDENIKQYLMKGGICILKHSTNKKFDYIKEFY